MYHFIDPQTGNIDTEKEQAYREAVQEGAYDEVFGTITFVDPEIDPISITPDVLPLNAVAISKQCVDNDTLMFGGVFTYVLKLSIYTDTDRYAFYNAKIELGYKIQIGVENDEPAYAEVPLGIFTVADADRPHSDIVNLTAYDPITSLDINLGSLQLSGTPWQLFEVVKSMTGYDLAFTEEDLENYPNHTVTISASEEDGIRTYRDVVKEACQLLGCFAMDNRRGKLTLKKFSKIPDLSLDISSWYSMTPADYKCNYIGVSITGKAGTFEKFDTEHSDRVGLVWTVSDAPAWDYGPEEEQLAKVENLYNIIVGNEDEEIEGIEYTPAKISMPDDPTFDCGDMLQLTARNGDVINTIITSIEWKFHQGMDVESVGINPLIEGSTPASQGTDRLVNQSIEKNKIQFLSVVNNAAFNVGDGEVAQLCEFRFTPTALADSLFVGTFLLQANVADEEYSHTETTTETVSVPVKPYYNEQETTVTDINGNPVTLLGTATNTYTYTDTYKRDGKCEVTIYYVLDDNILPHGDTPYYAKATLAGKGEENSKHIISLTYPLNNLVMGHGYHLQVFVTVSGGTLSVGENAIRATLFGQEINDVSEFDGIIDVNENPVGYAEFGIMTPRTFYEDADNTSVEIIEPAKCIATDTVSLYNIVSISVKSIAEGTGEFVPQIYLETVPITTEDGIRLCTEDEIDFYTDVSEVQEE